jgi:DNA polymerase IV
MRCIGCSSSKDEQWLTGAVTQAVESPTPERRILHVDMDAFYASVEEREDPTLVGKPVVVGGPVNGRGVVSAANYVARQYGVHSAMPAALAARLCPQAIFIKPRHSLYAEASRHIHAVFADYTPLVEPLALDEAFLDITGSQALFGSAADIARRIKSEILESTQLVASVGLAPNKFLAKVASDIDKPDGFVEVKFGEERGFLGPLPVTRVWGVGRRTAEILERLGVNTISDLRGQPDDLLTELFGQYGARLRALADGVDDRPVVPEHEAKSISHETTFGVDVTDKNTMHVWLIDLADQVASRARRLGLKGRTIMIKVRFGDFRTLTRSMSLPARTQLTKDVRDAVNELFVNRLGVELKPVRLLGVGLSGFDAIETPQADLFGDQDREHEEQVDAVLDKIRNRFGGTALRRGRNPRGSETSDEPS